MDQGLKVLVVEPMSTALHAVSARLRQLGITKIDHALDGRLARDRIADGDYGLVLSEWDLNPFSGFDLLKAVRSDPRTRHLPFVLMTHQVEVDRVIAARQAGVSGYLVKPFSEVLLKQKLVAIMQG